MALQTYHPWIYQSFCESKIIEIPYIALFVDMGLGKTVITLTAIQHLIYDFFAVSRVLVIAPKKVAEDTWSAEAAKWDHLQDLRISTVLGTVKQREKALADDADVYVINRENVQWLVEHFKGKSWPFDCVVLDESSSFKNSQSKRFKALRSVRSQINRVIELTGTPAPQSMEDLWAQVYLLDGGKRLGRTLTVYREIYFNPGRRNRTVIYDYKPKPGAATAIYAAISDICISLKAEDYLTLPEIMYQDIPVKLDQRSQSTYDRFERDAVLDVLDETGEGASTITAGTAAVLTGKLLQMCNGAVYDENKKVQNLHNCKLDSFIETVEGLQGEHALVFYAFRHDVDRLLDVLADRMPSLRVRVYKTASDKDDWNAGKVDLLLAHPASCGYGLNLQAGGRHVIWFGLTYSLEQYQQANKRLHRQGQTKPVMVHHLIVKTGVDVDVMAALRDKDKTQEALLQALKARIIKIKNEGE